MPSSLVILLPLMFTSFAPVRPISFLEVVQNFWNDTSSKTAKEYFEIDFTNYLNNGNWNLDTGIQCEFNNTKELHEGNEKMNEAHIDTLTNNYNIFNELYKNLFENDN